MAAAPGDGDDGVGPSDLVAPRRAHVSTLPASGAWRDGDPMGRRQRFTLGPIMHHKKPSAHSFFRCMQGVAGNSLLNLRQQRFRVADEEIANVFAILEFRSQYLDRAADHATFHLHQAPIERDATIHGGEKT